MSFGPSVRNGLGIGLGPTATLATAFSQATLDFDFIDNQVFPTDITFTRASSATMFDSSGTLIFAPMNAIRNNTMVGAVAGTPGTLPTNWAISGLGTLTQTVVGTGTANGITYIDLRFSGTTSTTVVSIRHEPGGTGGVAAANGQSWAQSAWTAVIAGSTTNITQVGLSANIYDSGGAFLASVPYTNFIANTTSTLTRVTPSGTIATVGTAFIQPQIYLTFSSGAAIDITLRIGMPQLQRGSTATAVNATSGTAYQAPRLDYDPATLAPRGLLIEEQRVNSIRNNTMQGAVAGTPGTLPTNWVALAGGLAFNVIGTGTENGITYIDVQIVGTTSGTSANLRFEPNTQIVAANAQAWTSSLFVRQTAGTTANITDLTNAVFFRDGAGAVLTTQVVALTNLNAVSIRTNRISNSFTAANASTAFVNSAVQLTFNNGVAIDITLRIGLPQLELGAFATSVIPTTTAAATRSADVASVNTLSPWYNASAGTLYAEYSIPSALPAASNPTFASLVGTGGVGTNAIAAYINTPSGKNGSFNVWSSGSVVGRIDVSSNFVAGSVVKYAAAFAANDRAVTSGGFTPTTSSTAYTIPTVSSMTLGSDPTLAAINGYLRRITYYPSRLSNAQLQALTA